MAGDDLGTFFSRVEAIGTCMMTMRESGSLRARPMLAQIDPATHEFRFLTKLSSHKTDELAANPDVNLAFSDSRAGRFISVSGQAYLTQDRSLIDQLWTARSQARFGCGKDDADIAVIRVVPSEAECWDAKGRLEQAWKVFKSQVRTGGAR